MISAQRRKDKIARAPPPPRERAKGGKGRAEGCARARPPGNTMSQRNHLQCPEIELWTDRNLTRRVLYIARYCYFNLTSTLTPHLTNLGKHVPTARFRSFLGLLGSLLHKQHKRCSGWPRAGGPAGGGLSARGRGLRAGCSTWGEWCCW